MNKDINELNKKLVVAVMDGNVNEVKSLIREGADVNYMITGKDGWGKTFSVPVSYYAKINGDMKILEVLQKKGAKGIDVLAKTIKK